jgi:hypothetical protein
LLTEAANSETASIGELKGLTSNAMVMVKMAIFSAWADLQIASSERKYLVDALKPRIAKLTPLWLASLREFARLRFEPDISTTSPGAAALSGNLDSIYAALNRETLLQVRHLTTAMSMANSFAVLPIIMAETRSCHR